MVQSAENDYDGTDYNVCIQQSIAHCVLYTAINSRGGFGERGNGPR